jgi:hypothetical protein
LSRPKSFLKAYAKVGLYFFSNPAYTLSTIDLHGKLIDHLKTATTFGPNSQNQLFLGWLVSWDYDAFWLQIQGVFS